MVNLKFTTVHKSTTDLTVIKFTKHKTKYTTWDPRMIHMTAKQYFPQLSYGHLQKKKSHNVQATVSLFQWDTVGSYKNRENFMLYVDWEYLSRYSWRISKNFA